MDDTQKSQMPKYWQLKYYDEEIAILLYETDIGQHQCLSTLDQFVEKYCSNLIFLFSTVSWEDQTT